MGIWNDVDMVQYLYGISNERIWVCANSAGDLVRAVSFMGKMKHHWILGVPGIFGNPAWPRWVSTNECTWAGKYL